MPLLLLVLAAYVALVIVFFVAAPKEPKKATGQCYSTVMGSVATSVEQTSSPKDLAARIRELPMHGYETVCDDVERAARRLPDQP